MKMPRCAFSLRVALLAVSLALLCGCGNKGDLVRPSALGASAVSGGH